MRHSLFKYFSERKWADAFIDGQVLFRSLSYFRDYEDESVRSDQNEGAARFRPTGGPIINNLTQGTTFTLPGHAFELVARQDEIFVYCASKSLSDERCEKFGAVACVEVREIKTFCERIKAALPASAMFYGRRVDYYADTEEGNPRWALPENIATSKLNTYAWQDEYRLVFSLTNALAFENVNPRLVADDAPRLPKQSDHPKYLVAARSLGDICQLHEY